LESPLICDLTTPRRRWSTERNINLPKRRDFLRLDERAESFFEPEDQWNWAQKSDGAGCGRRGARAPTTRKSPNSAMFSAFKARRVGAAAFSVGLQGLGVVGCQMTNVEFAEKSALIGSIYDCALEPDLGVVESTVKTHLQNAFVKTGTSRQVDLITLLHRLLPVVRAPGEQTAAKARS
jgi:hypothetical protein